MRIDQIGGEFPLIETLAGIAPSAHSDLAVGVGDDAAVMRLGKNDDVLLLSTADTLVEGTHFRPEWSTPRQIGGKSVECNVSDIAAMGGTPTIMFVSLVLPENTTVEWVSELYAGMAVACEKYGIAVGGGDTTRGEKIVIGITLLGKVSPPDLCLRRHGEVGDLLAVTGPLGASAAGMALFQSQYEPCNYLKDKHFAPQCRLDAAAELAPIVNAMIDISDGLASEVNHICRQSKVGAILYEKDIPLSDEVIAAGKKLGTPPIDFALNGGEDYELLFSISPNKVKALSRSGVDHYVVGKLTRHEEGVRIEKGDGQISPIKGGYDHFRK